MIVVVGDVEGDDLPLLLIVVLDEGEYKASIYDACLFHLEVLLAAVDECFELYMAAVGHIELEFLTIGELGGVKRTCPQQHGHHIVDAFQSVIGSVANVAAVVEEALFEVGAAAGIIVPYLIDIIALALAGALAVVEGHKVRPDEAEEGIAHHKELVGALAASCDEVASKGLFAAVFGLADIEVGCASLDPDEFPVKVELVLEVLSCHECCILHRALSMERGRGREVLHVWSEQTRAEEL